MIDVYTVRTVLILLKWLFGHAFGYAVLPQVAASIYVIIIKQGTIRLSCNYTGAVGTYLIRLQTVLELDQLDAAW